MRRVELHQDTLEIVLTGLTRLEAMQGRFSIPYAHIHAVHANLAPHPNLLRLAGTAVGPNSQEGHYIDENGGWHFLSYENPNGVITIDLKDFNVGRQHYVTIMVEVDDPVSMAEAIQNRLVSDLNST